MFEDDELGSRVEAPTLASVVTKNPAAAAVLERFGLDYCCHGDRTLVDATSAAGVDLHVLEVEIALQPPTPSSLADPEALAHDIVMTHHRYLQGELPLLEALAVKVHSVHGERFPELVEVRRLVALLRADLEPHLLKEERVLFPAITAVVNGQREFPFGSVANPIRMMATEHDRAGALLHELREVTAGYAVPSDACASYASLYHRLEALEADTHLHIHKENNVLFPAVLALLDS